MNEETAQQATARAVLARVMRPLARIMLAFGLRLSDGVALMKSALVEAARAYEIEGRPLTDSRVALLTGVHRKDLRALRAADLDARPDRPRRNLTATLIGRWMADPLYRGADGTPRALPRKAVAGGSFEDLAAAVSTDLHPRTLLDELARLGAVEEREDGLLELRADALTPSREERAALEFFGANLGDHAEAAAHNLAGPGEMPRFLERAVFYNRLSEESVAALESLARRKAIEFLHEINEAALTAQQTDAGKASADRRFRAGIYLYHSTESILQRSSGSVDSKEN